MWAAKRWFRESYASFAVSPHAPRAKCGLAWSDRIVEWPLRVFPTPVAAAADQGLAAVAPRSGAVVAVPDFLRPAGAVFPQCRPLQQPARRHRLRHVDQHGQLSESGRRRADSFDVHHAVHLSDDQPGRALLLDSGSAADRARHDSVEQILVCVARFLDSVRGAGAAERPDAARVARW